MIQELPDGARDILNVLFDRVKYRARYPDVDISGVDALEHFLQVGRHIGRDPGFDLEGLLQGQAYSPEGAPPPFRSFGTIQHDPLISILIVSYNSGSDLETLFHSIAEQTYTHFEVILVENGEQDTEPLLRRHFSNAKYLRADNVGFAEGNNLASRIANGELFALVNPDTRLAPDALQMLLESLRFDSSAAAAVPRICFFERFVNLQIEAEAPFFVERAELLDGLSYQKLFVRTGIDDGRTLRSDDDGLLEVSIPFERARQTRVVLQGQARGTYCQTRIDFAPAQRVVHVDGAEFAVDLTFDAATCGNARHVINNAGSMFHPDGTPFDRGFAQVDDGRFLAKSYVDAFCGCAALIRRSAILDRNVFFGPSFAYYEDTELSRWLTKQGQRILYQPAALVFHRHSESTNEHSLSWTVLVNRGRQIYDAVIGGPDSDLTEFAVEYPPSFAGGLRGKLESLDQVIRDAGTPRALLAPPRPTACIYNSYFSSRGGGEKHALDIAGLLRDNFDVYLASESDFDIGDMESYFGIDLSGMRKLVCNHIDTFFTSKFDLFVNSTYRSDLVSAAKKSLYVVSFPHRHSDLRLSRNYHFLHNSSFTRHWADEYWDHHTSTILLPILGQAPLQSDSKGSSKLSKKERVILSVGRFTYDGHCKNHHLVVRAFKDLIDSKHIMSDWTLEIVGSCDWSKRDAVEYYRHLVTAAEGRENIVIRANASRDVLENAYNRCAIYVHAAGLGTSIDQPELHEHFGISTFEALMNGCIPVVYAIGGPAGQIEGLPVGDTFTDAPSLKEVVANAIATYETGVDWRGVLRAHAAQMMNDNRSAFLSVMNDVLMSLSSERRAFINGRTN